MKNHGANMTRGSFSGFAIAPPSIARFYTTGAHHLAITFTADAVDNDRHYAYILAVTRDEFKKLRTGTGHTQATLAKEMGVHLRTVTRWEIGEVIIPTVVELALRYIAEHTKKTGDRKNG